jgi:hypothetical protein
VADIINKALDYLIITLSALGMTLLLMGIVSDAQAKRLQHESVYSNAWCSSVGGVYGKADKEGTYPDCILPHYAVEADFADKWYEAVGQALHYSNVTDKVPGILLIIEEPGQCVHVKRMLSALRLSIVYTTTYGQVRYRVWFIGSEHCVATAKQDTSA